MAHTLGALQSTLENTNFKLHVSRHKKPILMTGAIGTVTLYGPNGLNEVRALFSTSLFENDEINSSGYWAFTRFTKEEK